MQGNNINIYKLERLEKLYRTRIMLDTGICYYYHITQSIEEQFEDIKREMTSAQITHNKKTDFRSLLTKGEHNVFDCR